MTIKIYKQEVTRGYHERQKFDLGLFLQLIVGPQLYKLILFPKHLEVCLKLSSHAMEGKVN